MSSILQSYKNRTKTSNFHLMRNTNALVNQSTQKATPAKPPDTAKGGVRSSLLNMRPTALTKHAAKKQGEVTLSLKRERHNETNCITLTFTS